MGELLFVRVPRDECEGPCDGVRVGSLTVSQKAAQKHIALKMYVCHNAPVHMGRRDTPEQVKKWFQDKVRELWPVAIGSLSLRKSPCIREHCRLCESGEGHSSYALVWPQRETAFFGLRTG